MATVWKTINNLSTGTFFWYPLSREHRLSGTPLLAVAVPWLRVLNPR
jgi:hypothetical protein